MAAYTVRNTLPSRTSGRTPRPLRARRLLPPKGSARPFRAAKSAAQRRSPAHSWVSRRLAEPSSILSVARYRACSKLRLTTRILLMRNASSSSWRRIAETSWPTTNLANCARSNCWYFLRSRSAVTSTAAGVTQSPVVVASFAVAADSAGPELASCCWYWVRSEMPTPCRDGTWMGLIKCSRVRLYRLRTPPVVREFLDAGLRFRSPTAGYRIISCRLMPPRHYAPLENIR